MRVVRGLAAILSGSLLGLAACSDGGEDPVVLPSGTQEPTSRPTMTESSPSTPSAAPTPTTTLVLPPTELPEADAFVREFFAAYNAAQDSRDLSAFDAMYLPQCEECIAMRDELVVWLADGETITGADWVISQQASFPSAPGDALAAVLAHRTEGSRSAGAVAALPVHLFNLNLAKGKTWMIETMGADPA